MGTFQRYNQLKKPLSNNSCGYSSTGCWGCQRGGGSVVDAFKVGVGGWVACVATVVLELISVFLAWKWDRRAKWLECDEEEEEESLRAGTAYPCMSISCAKYIQFFAHFMCFFSQLANTLYAHFHSFPGARCVPCFPFMMIRLHESFAGVIMNTLWMHIKWILHILEGCVYEQEMNCAVWHDRGVEAGLLTLWLDNLNMFVQAFGHPESRTLDRAQMSSVQIPPKQGRSKRWAWLHIMMTFGGPKQPEIFRKTHHSCILDGVWHSEPHSIQDGSLQAVP